MSLWKKIIPGILAAILLLAVTTVWLVTTTPGLHLLFGAASRWVPGLEIGQVSGNWRDLSLKHIHYARPGVAVSAGEIQLALQPQCLWKASLCVNNLALRDIRVAIDSKQLPPTPRQQQTRLPALVAPWPLKLDRLTLNNLNVSIDATHVSLMNLTSGLNWRRKDLTLTPTRIRGLLIRLPQAAAKSVNPPREKTPGEQLAALFSAPLLAPKNDIRLPLNLTIEELRGEQLRLTGATDFSVRSMLLTMSASDDHIRLQTLSIAADQGRVDASGNARLHDNWPLDLTVNATLNSAPLPGGKITLQASGALRDRLDLAVNVSGPLDLRTRAQVQLARAGLPVNLQVNSQRLYWPLSGEKHYQADSLRLKLSGKMTGYALSVQARLKGREVPPATITLDAQGNAQQLNLDRLTIAALAGKTELKGVLDWRQALSWRGELTLHDIDLASALPHWPARLNGVVQSRASYHGDSWQLDIPQIKINGKLKHNSIAVVGALKGNNYLQWRIPQLLVTLGRNSATVTGELGIKTLSLNASIDAPNLDKIAPGLGGSVRGFIKADGAIDAPRLQTDITARQLRWQDVAVNLARLQGEVKSDTQIAGHLNARLEGLRRPGVNVRLLTLMAQGSEKQHHLQLQMQGDPFSAQFDLAGSFGRATERWQGVLSHTRLRTPVGPWRQTRPVTLDYHHQEQKISIGPHCWLNPDASLCLPQTIEVGKTGRALLRLDRFDLALLKPFMPPQTQARGIFSGNAKVSWDSAGKESVVGQVTLSGRNVQVTRTVNDAPLSVAFDTLRLNADLRNNQLDLGWLIRLVNKSQFDGRMRLTDLTGRRDLAGSVNIRNFPLDMLNVLFTQDGRIAGTLNTTLRLAGNMAQPLLFGQARLNGVDIDGDIIPFDMQPGWLTLDFNGARSTLQGLLPTPQGPINLSGDADWNQINRWRASVALRASRVRITIPPMARMDIAPDVVFSATPALITLDGKVDVPWGRIVVDKLPESTVAVSDDEVMLNNNLQLLAPKEPDITLKSNLKIHIGNDVYMDAFGLKAMLTGDLTVAQDKQGLGLNGRITLPQGRFSAWGQDLIVRKGELLFSGPADRPLLNIEAIRNPDATDGNVIAGVRVTGIADEPKAEIFSDPAMSQQEALSWLLRGQGLDSEQRDNAVITSMLISLGVAQSGHIVGKIGKAFGVNNLMLDTQGAGDSSQLVVSGYVLPGLQVKYGVGIFDSLATLTLRYRLMPKLYLEAVSGVDQALDLLYQFEF